MPIVAPIALAAVSVSVEKKVPRASSAVKPNATYAVANTVRRSRTPVLNWNSPMLPVSFPLKPENLGTTTGCAPNRTMPATSPASATTIVAIQINTAATNAFAISSRPRATGRMSR